MNYTMMLAPGSSGKGRCVGQGLSLESCKARALELIAKGEWKEGMCFSVVAWNDQGVTIAEYTFNDAPDELNPEWEIIYKADSNEEQKPSYLEDYQLITVTAYYNVALDAYVLMRDGKPVLFVKA